MPRKHSSSLLFVCLLAALFLPPTASADLEPLTLRINDGTAVPGGVLAVVIRTYSPRGVGQGQVCFSRGAELIGDGPLTELIEARVFSDEDDAVVSANFDPQTQELVLDFASASATINHTDGPMISLLFRVDDQLAPGTSFTLSLDPESFLLDAQGQPIDIEPRAGQMTLRSPLAAYELEADGADGAPGLWAAAGVSSVESLPLSAGTVVFLYDPAVVSGTPEIVMSPRHGASTVSVVHSAGRVAVSFTSADASLNTVPGQFVTVRLPIAPGVTLGDTSVVSLESGTTELFDMGGVPLTLALTDGVLLFVHPLELALFYDGFESGDVDDWCLSVGAV